MAVTPIKPITSGYNTSRINDNFDNIQTKIDQVLLATQDGQNTMYQDLDLNSHNILNGNILNVQGLTIAGSAVSPTNLGSLGPNTVATTQIIDGAVTDAKITSVSSSKSLYNQTGAGGLSRAVQNFLSDQMVSVKNFSNVLGNGINDDTIGIQSAITYAQTVNKAVYFPAGTYLTGKLTLFSNTTLVGENSEKSVLILKAGANTNLLESSTFQANFKQGNNNLGDVGVTIKSLTLDGNRASNSSTSDALGAGVAIYGERQYLSQVFIRNCAGCGLVTDGPIYGGPSADLGMESHYERVVVDTVGRHGWYFNGSHDTTAVHIICIDASLNADNTYHGLYVNSPARFVSYHGWTRSTGARHASACYVDVGATGSEFVACQFEGAAAANVMIFSGGNFFDSTCQYYAAFGGTNIFLAGNATQNDIRGGVNQTPAGYPNPIGVSISNDPAHYVAGNTIDLMMAQQLDSNIYFGAGDKGHNVIKINAYQTSGARYSGTPHPTDKVEVNVFGNTSVDYAPLRPVAYVTFDGTAATPILQSLYNVSSVTKTSTGHYTINFTNPIGTGSTMLATASATNVVGRPYGNSTTSQDIICNNLSGIGTDNILISVMFYAN